MSDNEQPETFHFDIYGVFPDGLSLLLGHGDLPASTGIERYEALVKLLRDMADRWEQGAKQYEAALRVFQTPLGDKYFEVSTDNFAPGDTYEDALKMAQSSVMVLTWDQLKHLFPDLKEIGK